MQPAIPPILVTLATILAFFLIILAILWTILPFAIFGTKKRLELIRDELVQLRRHIETARQVEAEAPAQVEKRQERT